MPNETPEWMILDSFRYALGRMTMQVTVTTLWLSQHWDSLSAELQERIKKELDEEITRDSKARELGVKHLPLGMDIDRAEWVRLWVEINNNQGSGNDML